MHRKCIFLFIPNTKVKKRYELNGKSLGHFNYLKSAQTYNIVENKKQLTERQRVYLK